MTGPIREKINLWRDVNKGFKTRFSNKLNEPVIQRNDLEQELIQNKIERGDRLQKLRLRFNPSVDINLEKNFAGKVDDDLDEIINTLVEMGFRNNPTSYVEVSEEHGPDDGSYSRQIITETAGRFNIPQLVLRPAIYRRKKRQVHVVLYETDNGIIIAAHEEQSAWLQPARHVIINDASARIGVRKFRNQWFDEFKSELPGKDEVIWEVAH